MSAPTGPGHGRGPVTPVRGAGGVEASEQLRREREELSATVQALADRFDVGARARDAAGSVRTSAAELWDRAVRSPLFVPVLTTVGALVGLAASAGRVRRPS